MNLNSQSGKVREFLSQVAEEQALSPGSGAIFNSKVNLQAAYNNFETAFTELGLKCCRILTPVNSLSEIRRSSLMMSQSASTAAREPKCKW